MKTIIIMAVGYLIYKLIIKKLDNNIERLMDEVNPYKDIFKN